MKKFKWQFAEVKAIIQETKNVKTFVLKLPQWIPHLPGQHYDIRLTAEDGYQAQRSYSIASPQERINEIDLTIELVESGEISSYLHEYIAVGDKLEVRGPIGGYFIWEDNMKNTPLFLVAGGSGIVPLMAMLRHRLEIGASNPTTLLYSVKTEEDFIFRNELMELNTNDINFNLILTFTRKQPLKWKGYKRRINKEMLVHALTSTNGQPNCFICGPTLLVENVANTLVDIGLPTEVIKTERFGPTGNILNA